MEPIGIGIIGCGKIAQLRHIPELAADGRCRLVGYYNPTALRAEQMAEKYGGRVYGSAEELLSDPDISAVVISTPNNTHAALSIMAMNAGKHVLCEKPMAAALAECEQMLAVSDKTGKKLMIGMNQRLAGAHVKARSLILAGEIGRPISFRTEFGHSGPENWSITPGPSTWFFNREKAAIGAMADLGIHKTDLIQYLCGSNIVRTTARLATIDKCGPDGEPIAVDDNAFCIYELENGCVGTMTASWTHYGSENNSTIICGTLGELRIFDDPACPLILKKKDGSEQRFMTGAIQTNDNQTSSGVAELWLSSLLNSAEQGISGESVLPAMRAVFASVQSSETGRTVEIPENRT